MIQGQGQRKRYSSCASTKKQTPLTASPSTTTSSCTPFRRSAASKSGPSWSTPLRRTLRGLSKSSTALASTWCPRNLYGISTSSSTSPSTTCWRSPASSKSKKNWTTAPSTSTSTHPPPATTGPSATTQPSEPRQKGRSSSKKWTGFSGLGRATISV